MAAAKDRKGCHEPQEAKNFPSGLNFTEEMDFVCPRSTRSNLYSGVSLTTPEEGNRGGGCVGGTTGGGGGADVLFWGTCVSSSVV
jgi:hypothetical protein